MNDIDFECQVCGVGEFLPSGVCDHCDSKAPDHPSRPRPIETAPKDWSRVLLIDDKIANEWQIGAFNRIQKGWLDDYGYKVFPTHWLPLPPAP